MRKGFLAVGLLLLILAVFLVRRGGGFSSSEADALLSKAGTPSKSKNSAASTKASSKSNGLVRLTSSPGVIPSDNFPEYGAHEPSQLKEFQLPDFEAENVTLREAIERILQSYVDVCTVTKQEPIIFSLDLTELSNESMDVRLSGSSLTSMLMRVGFQFGNRFSRDEAQLNFHPFKDTIVGEDSRTHSVQVFPSFQEDLAQFLSLTDEEGGVRDLSFSELFQQMGLGLARGNSVRFVESSSTLIMRDSSANIEAFTAIFEELDRAPIQFRNSTRLISSDKELVDLPTGWHSPEEVQVLMRRVAQSEGAEIGTLPSVLARADERALVEVGGDWAGEGSADIRLSSETSLYGFGLQESISLESSGEQIQFQKSDVRPNSGSLIHPIETADGRYFYAIITSGALDVTGRQLTIPTPVE